MSTDRGRLVVALPGLHASGRDIDELRDALAEAIGFYLSDATHEVTATDLEFVPPPELRDVHIRTRLVAA
ncbi:type II toxin-antitoxin system HicB family antitoxin [Plantactinospora solaniradicis]|uniref:Type II toxin-antitoxin system HicB family antitoxin n=1 Tax=Plantactinospora solaniradicis TaxID=1723736 RepID=A0ABW1KAA8_9ACTN